ncbi:hypothetical protein [Streptomyces niveiscabiei]|uniref:hypothetical protein n=1 Tax=Streptomyces niveiscabiei TaxID=164115 RepID=UPI0006EB64B8
MRRGKKDGGEVLFAGQAGIRSDQVTGRARGRQGGKTPVVRRTGNRLSVNAMSAISAKGRTHFVVFPESFTADVMCRFPERLAAHLDDVEPHFLPPGTRRGDPPLLPQTPAPAAHRPRPCRVRRQQVRRGGGQAIEYPMISRVARSSRLASLITLPLRPRAGPRPGG